MSEYLNIPKTKPLTSEEKLKQRNDIATTFRTNDSPLSDRFSDFRRKIAEQMSTTNKAKAQER